MTILLNNKDMAIILKNFITKYCLIKLVYAPKSLIILKIYDFVTIIL